MQFNVTKFNFCYPPFIIYSDTFLLFLGQYTFPELLNYAEMKSAYFCEKIIYYYTLQITSNYLSNGHFHKYANNRTSLFTDIK